MNPESSYILDSFALMSYLGGEPSQERIKDLLRQASAGKVRLMLCMINFGEVLYTTERRRGFAAAQNVQALIEDMPIKIINATRKLVLDAAHIKANYALSYADAFVAALAEREKGIILTGDPEFQTVEGLVSIEWLER